MSKTLTEQLALHSTNNGQDYTNIYPNQAWTLEEYKELYTMIGQGLLVAHPDYNGGYMLSRYAEDEADGVMWIGGEGEVMHAVWYTKEDYFSGGHYLTDKNDDNIEMINDWQDEHNVGGDPDSDEWECEECGATGGPDDGEANCRCEKSDDEDNEPSGVRECRVGMTRYLIDPLTRELYDHKVFMETGEAKFIAVLNKDQTIHYL